MKEIKLVPGPCKECYFAEVKGCSVQCNLPSHHSCRIGETCYKEVPVTNGDMIRQMSNQGIALIFEGMSGKPAAEWLEWLNSEAEENEK